MSSPELALYYGGPNWTPSLMASTQPQLEKVLDMTIDGLDYLDLWPNTKANGSVFRFPKSKQLNCTGYASNSRTFELNLNINRDDRLKQRQVSALAATALHELVHCKRMNRFKLRNSFFERAATEGLAHCAEDLYIDEFCFRQVAKNTDQKIIKPDDILEDKFIEAANANMGNHTPGMYNYWFERSDKGGFPRGVLYGIQRVNELLQQHGYTVVDLIHEPAYEILGLE